MEKLSFRLPVFEGPLDALLYLVSKNKLNIYEISISELLDQYLGYLSEMSKMDLEITSEFLEMASRLVQIKSAELLPKAEEDKTKHNEFLTALIEYKTCKAMAQALSLRNAGMNCFVRQPQLVKHDETYTCKHKTDELLKAYKLLGSKIKSRRPPTTDSFRGIVGRKIVSVASRIIHVIKKLLTCNRRSFNSMFEDSTGRSEAVATFLALLELVKSNRIVIDDDENKTIKLKKVRSKTD